MSPHILRISAAALLITTGSIALAQDTAATDAADDVETVTVEEDDGMNWGWLGLLGLAGLAGLRRPKHTETIHPTGTSRM